MASGGKGGGAGESCKDHGSGVGQRQLSSGVRDRGPAGTVQDKTLRDTQKKQMDENGWRTKEWRFDIKGI